MNAIHYLGIKRRTKEKKSFDSTKYDVQYRTAVIQVYKFYKLQVHGIQAVSLISWPKFYP